MLGLDFGFLTVFFMFCSETTIFDLFSFVWDFFFSWWILVWVAVWVLDMVALAVFLWGYLY